MDEGKLEKKEIQIKLSPPSLDFKDSFLSALEEYKKEGRKLDEGVRNPGDDFDAFLKSLKDESLGLNLVSDRVPQTTYWITDDDGYAGRISIRHTLNNNLLRVGGHIGYGIRPSKRGLGYASKALELALSKAKELGLDKVLLTCDNTNIASRKVIEKNGGIFENEVEDVAGKPNKLRFWINLK